MLPALCQLTCCYIYHRNHKHVASYYQTRCRALRMELQIGGEQV